MAVPQQSPRLYTFDLVLTANQRVTLPLHSEFLYIQEATGAINVYVGSDNNKARLAAGLQYRCPPGQAFERFDIEDASGAGNTIRISYGFGEFEDNRLTLSGGVTIAVPANIDDAADVTLNNGAETSLGAAPANTKTRMIVADPANTVNIRIGKTGQVGAARGALLQPGQSMVLDGSMTPFGFAGAAGQKVSQLFLVT